MSHNSFNNFSQQTSSTNTNYNNEQLETKSIQEQLNDLRQLLQDSEQRIMRRIDLVRDETQRNFRTMRNELDQIQINEIKGEPLIELQEQHIPPNYVLPQLPSINLKSNNELMLTTMDDFNIFEMQIVDPQIRFNWVRFFLSVYRNMFEHFFFYNFRNKSWMFMLKMVNLR